MPLAADLKFNIIPQPSQVLPVEGTFRLAASTPISVDPSAGAGTRAAEFLSSQLRRAKAAKLQSISDTAPAIHFRASTQEVGGEGYALNIEPKSVSIEACAAAGWFYGVQTLLHLLPQSVSAQNQSPAESALPCVRIIESSALCLAGADARRF